MSSASNTDPGPMPSHCVFYVWHSQSQAMCMSDGGKTQPVCLWYYISLWIWAPWTTTIKFFFVSTPTLADASIIAEQMFSIENLFLIPYDEESPSENKQMYIPVSSSKTQPSISDEKQQMLCALGNRYQTDWKSLKDLFLSVISIWVFLLSFPASSNCNWNINSGFYCFISPSQVCIKLTKDIFINWVMLNVVI